MPDDLPLLTSEQMETKARLLIEKSIEATGEYGIELVHQALELLRTSVEATTRREI
jgi:hypothetical protein